MPNYLQENRDIQHRKFGGYCNMCRELGITPKTFHNFTMDDYLEVKTKYRVHKKNLRGEIK